MADYAFHEAAAIFPLLQDDALDGLADDIVEHGLLEPIELLDGEIIDGRNRYRACLMRGVEPDFYDVEPDDPVSYVISRNLHRRHLNESQRGMVGARAEDHYAKLAKERIKAGGQAGGKKRQGDPKGVENLPPPSKARDQAGAAVNVSGKTIDHASTVLEKGSAKLVKAVDSGEVAVSTGAKLAKNFTKAEQDEALKGGKDAIKKTIAPYPASDKFIRVMGELAGTLQEVQNDYGSVAKMFRRRDWDKAQTTWAVQFIQSFAKTFTDLKKELKDVAA